MMRRTLLVLIFAIFPPAVAPLHGQLAANAGDHTIRVRRINDAHLKIDGKLD